MVTRPRSVATSNAVCIEMRPPESKAAAGVAIPSPTAATIGMIYFRMGYSSSKLSYPLRLPTGITSPKTISKRRGFRFCISRSCANVRPSRPFGDRILAIRRWGFSARHAGRLANLHPFRDDLFYQRHQRFRRGDVRRMAGIDLVTAPASLVLCTRGEWTEGVRGGDAGRVAIAARQRPIPP